MKEKIKELIKEYVKLADEEYEKAKKLKNGEPLRRDCIATGFTYYKAATDLRIILLEDEDEK